MTIGVVEEIDVDGSALFHCLILRHSAIGDLRCSRKSLNQPLRRHALHAYMHGGTSDEPG